MKYITLRPTVVGPQLADSLLKEPPYQYQRKVNQNTVDFYANQMVKGRWRGGDSMIVFGRAKGGESFYLLNGQHRFQAIIKSGVAVEIVLAEIEYDSTRELDEAYASFDTGRRSDAERLQAVGTIDAVGVPVGLFNRVVSAVRFIYAGGGTAGGSGLNRALRDPMELDSVVRKWAPEGAIAGRLINLSSMVDRTSIQRAPTLAAILLTLRYFPPHGGDTDAWEFWRPVVENDGLRKGDPGHALRAYGLSMPVGQGGSPAHFEAFCKCLHAFNAYRAGREIHLIRPMGKARLDGTPIQDGVNWVAIANKEF